MPDIQKLLWPKSVAIIGASSDTRGLRGRSVVDGVQEPIARTNVTGRGDGVLGDFTGELAFTNDSGAAYGVLVLTEPSARDGATVTAAVIRVVL